MSRIVPSRFLGDDGGTVMIYVAVVLAVLVGVVGLALDGGRLFTTNTQAWEAADAAALAAASQLDGKPGAITRATNAAKATTPLVQNRQTFAGGGSVTIDELCFLKSLPNDTEAIGACDEHNSYRTMVDAEARFVRATTSTLTMNNMFVMAVGSDATATTSATAVAGFKEVVCRFPPLMICNPWEDTSTSFPPPGIDVRGRQVLAKTKGSGAGWAPGDFGLLDPPDGNNGASAIADKLAKVWPEGCYEALVDVRPGEANSTRTAFNTRFDVYENPYFKNANDKPEYRPARNVIKGKVHNPLTNGCKIDDPVPSSAAQKLPEDTCFTGGGSCTTVDGQFRIGDGIWDRNTYWTVNHGALTKPTGYSPATDLPTLDYSQFSRYYTYRWEIDTGHIPNNAGRENGNPMCYSGSTPVNDTPDRRILSMAVINCREQGVHGSLDNVRVEAFVEMFLTEPVSLDSASQANVWLEFVRVMRPGNRNAVVRDIVQLYR